MSDNFACLNLVVKTKRSPRLSDDVARQLEQWIAEQQLQPGDQLPTEKVLCERFGVSRAVVREAVSRLKADGCVLTRQGSGAYVAARPGLGVFRLVLADADPLAALPPGLSDVFELRYLMETGVTALAARRRTVEDIEHMRAALGRMRAALDAGADGAVDDDAFHVAVAAATHNPQLERFQQFMGQQLSSSRTPTWSEVGHRAGWAQLAQEGHERIFAAIVAGDVEAARRAAADHLVSAALRLGLDPARWPALDAAEGRA